MKAWRFLDSGYAQPAFNMAADEVIGESCRSERTPVFRIYGWRPAGFSIGYAQDLHAVLDVDACTRDGVPIVRRVTGGGIIYHGREITYSIACSEEDLGSSRSVREGYKTLCSFLMAAYRRLGLTPSFAADGDSVRKRQSSFCFASHCNSDVLVNGRKIGGNAQRRSKGLILQHGSIPLVSDVAAAEKYVWEPLDLAGMKTAALSEVAGRDVSFEEMQQVLRAGFEEAFPGPLTDSVLSPAEEGAVARLVREKYASDSWTLFKGVNS